MKLAIVTAYPPSKVTLNEYAYHLVKNFRLKEEITEIEKRLGKKYNFQIIEHRLDVTGYCSDCRDNA